MLGCTLEGTLCDFFFSLCNETRSLFSFFQELSKITMPVIFNEPLSFLQRLTEYMEHTYLIHRANTSSDSIERMKVVCIVTSCKWLKLPQMQPCFNWSVCFEFSVYDLECVFTRLLAVCGCVCGVGCGLPVGADGETLQPSAGRNLWTGQVRWIIEHVFNSDIYILNKIKETNYAHLMPLVLQLFIPLLSKRLCFSSCLFKNTRSALIGQLTHAWASTGNNNGAAVLCDKLSTRFKLCKCDMMT